MPSKARFATAGPTGTKAYKAGHAAGQLAARNGFARKATFHAGPTTIDQQHWRLGWWDAVAAHHGLVSRCSPPPERNAA